MVSKVFFVIVGSISILLAWNLEESYLLSWMFTKKKIEFSLEILLDWFSLIFLGVLLMMVFSVNEFSIFYMGEDMSFSRFYWVLMSFVLSMCMVIFFPNLFSLMMGWDGLGVTSFLLMAYYNTYVSWFSSLKTYLINRLGDGFFMYWVINFVDQGHWNIFLSNSFWKSYMLFLVVLGLLTKSAIFPFSKWLPAAMAAPTPVSALVHSSTLVTAGMFILFRLSFCFSKSIFFFILIVSSYTSIMASFAACFEWDMKKVIAFSTLSQLGLMGVSLGCGFQNLCFYHLLTHAVFKALLFICGGILMGQFFHFQDLRKMGKKKEFNPLVDFCMLVSLLSLSGFPFLSGFFSKDLMVETNITITNFIFLSMLLFSLPLTVYYSFRLIFFIWKKSSFKKNIWLSLNLSKIYSVGGLVMLSLLIGNLLKNSFFICLNPTKMFKKNILFLLLVGSLLMLFYSTNNKWYSSNIFFSESNNSTLWNYFFSKSCGAVLNFDQGVKENLNSSLFNILNISKNMKNLLLFSFKSYFMKVFFFLGVIVLFFLF